MTRFAYHDLYPAQFEELVVAICTMLLGPAVQSFSTGPDGGRDSRFSGTARELPNERAPYSGSFVVQAKHTEDPFAKFSDPDFSGDSASSVLTKEILRLRALVDENEADYYLLFSNRRLAGNAEAQIRQRITAEAGPAGVTIFGIESIERLLKQYPPAIAIANISEVNLPLRVPPDDLAEVILAMAENKAAFSQGMTPSAIHRTTLKEKNRINGLGKDFDRLIRRDYLPHFAQMRRFLAQAPNQAILERYLNAAAEFNEQIVAHRNEWVDFGKALVFLQRILFQRDGDLRRNRRLTKLAVYYMYWNCDVGEDASDDA